MRMVLWFDKKHRTESFNISSKMHEVNEKLMNIQPPNCIALLPRPLSDIDYFKAAEYKSFMLFHALPSLWGVLPDDIFLAKARKMLIHFCIDFPALYGKIYQTSNLHLLLHAADKVQDLGPIWAKSCFYFEDYNGELRRLFHGTQIIEMQVAVAASIIQTLLTLAESLTCGTSGHAF